MQYQILSSRKIKKDTCIIRLSPAESALSLVNVNNQNILYLEYRSLLARTGPKIISKCLIRLDFPSTSLEQLQREHFSDQTVLIISLLLHKNLSCGTLWNCLPKAIPLSTQKLCVHGEIMKNIRLATPLI